MKKFRFIGLKFLLVVMVLYLVVIILDFDKLPMIWSESISIWKEVLPIFALVIILTTIISFYIKPKYIAKHLGKDSGAKGVFYALLGGILSHGPMYVWYGMFEEMRAHGLKDGLMATFFYARAVKLPMLPFMVELFGITFTIVINLYILLFAVIQGKIMDILMQDK